MSKPNSLSVAAAIDIGSNSIKMTVGRRGDDGGIEQVAWASEVVRLGQDLEHRGRLDDSRIEVAISTLQRFAAEAKEHGASRILAVATEATRAAANGAAFLDRVRRETGIEVRVVAGLEEAELTFRGLSATTDMSGAIVIADIGGGSTELIVASDGTMVAATSIPLGSGRLTDRLIHSDPPTPREIEASESDATSVIRVAAKSLPLPSGKGVRLVVVGGTGEFMAKLVPDEMAITLTTVRQVLAKLAVLTAAELADEIGVPEARARVLPAGVAIVAAVTNVVQADRVEIARSGIRAGLLMEAFSARTEDGSDGTGPAAVEGKLTAHVVAGEPHVNGAANEPDFRAAMKSLIAERWSVVWQTIPAALDGVDIEGVHDVRVASRRLRAAMDTAAPVFPQGWYRPLHRAAKEITGALGEVRDRDVLLEALRADREAAPLAEHPGIDRLIDRIEGERIEARARMEDFLNELQAGPLSKEVERRFGPRAIEARDANARVRS
jgi:hypothetical protein